MLRPKDKLVTFLAAEPYKLDSTFKHELCSLCASLKSAICT